MINRPQNNLPVLQLARLYDVRHDSLRGSYSHQAPLLDACFQDNSTIFTAGLDSLVKRWVRKALMQGRFPSWETCPHPCHCAHRYDFFGHAEAVVGQHSQPVRCVEYLKDQGLLASGSWDNTLRLWDPKSPFGKNCASLISLPGKVFSMAQSGTRLVVGTSGRHVLIYDIRRSVEDACMYSVSCTMPLLSCT